MAKKYKVPRPYCGNTMTLAMMRSFIMNMLRKKSLFWKPKQLAMRRGRSGTVINPDTGRPNIAVICVECNTRVAEKEAKLDHIEPVVDPRGFLESNDLFCGYNWNEIMPRMFCEVDNYQILCKECHDIKSKAENEERKRLKGAAENDTK